MNKKKCFQFKIFSQKSGILHYVSTKYFGNMSLYTATDIQKVIENRKNLAQELNIDLNNFVFQQQVHGAKCSIVESKDKAKGVYSYASALNDNDAMITATKGVCITVMAGDCVPLLFFDTQNKVIAAAHAGWRGTYKKIAQKTVEKMTQRFNSKPKYIIAGIGPSISAPHYEVDDLVYNEFKKHIPGYNKFFSEGKEKGKYYLDLWAANKAQLLSAGLKEANIEISALCTYADNHLFFSARRGEEERFTAGIMLL